MDVVLLILSMAIIGAIIGSATNFLAIKMIFRPYNALYLGKWKLPFTPGLIPKRRGELARQIGVTVQDYLLTPDVIKNKLFSQEIRFGILQFAQSKSEELIFLNNKTLKDWLELAGINGLPEKIEGQVDDFIEKQFVSFKHTLSTKSIEEVLPEDITKTINQKVPELVTTIIQRGEDYILSSKGEITIKNLLDDFLSSKGTIGGLFQMFFSDSSSIVSKIQHELVRLLRSSETKSSLVNIMNDEWGKIKKQPIMNYLNEIQLEPILINIQSYAKRELAIEERFNKSINYYFPNGNDWVKYDLMPKIVDKALELAESKLEDVLKKLDIKEVVREQVDSFPIEKLEEIVIGIANRELMMITLLGGFLGGLIGIVQGLIVQFLN
ncbi:MULTISPECIES: DUF445 family protein [Ureibacillus]|uniref:Uncharacterized membrane protein YheB (UPF0754 family) n=1 Tax=Ureibacillus thermosphaericus TaxID=51173 RepID=A0A840PMK5_URETH|nr:DUF445 family protein [Ureibacillus thermosphaericus]MBB5149645.1 uncharacterized membrane protein YheB (UPF0754 family) [Ureibacillus thermosphaericus]NKZ32445.1 DUF445 family protein [Ureibacillus thermosphaericus]